MRRAGKDPSVLVVSKARLISVCPSSRAGQTYSVPLLLCVHRSGRTIWIPVLLGSRYQGKTALPAVDHFLLTTYFLLFGLIQAGSAGNGKGIPRQRFPLVSQLHASSIKTPDYDRKIGMS
jgi:hypothetical protein